MDLGWEEKEKGKRNGLTRLSEILKVLKKNKLVERIGSTEMYQLPNGKPLPPDAEIDETSKKLRVKVTLKNEPKFYPWPLPIVENTKGARWIIKAEGRRESKNQFLKFE